MCDGEKTEDDIVDDLARETKIERNEIKKAVSDILTRLEHLGLVQKV